MPRRKSLFSGPKRRTVKLGPLRQNYKGIVPTSTSIGNSGGRINFSARGTRTSTKIPGTNIRVQGSLGTGRRRAPQPGPTDPRAGKKRGCLPGCSPLVLVLFVAAAVVVLAIV